MKICNFGAENGRFWGLFLPTHRPYGYRVFYGVFGVQWGIFGGFLHPIDLCRVKVRYFGANLGNFGVKMSDFGAENGGFGGLFAPIRRCCVYRVFYGVFGVFGAGNMGFFWGFFFSAPTVRAGRSSEANLNLPVIWGTPWI